MGKLNIEDYIIQYNEDGTVLLVPKPPIITIEEVKEIVNENTEIVDRILKKCEAYKNLLYIAEYCNSIYNQRNNNIVYNFYNYNDKIEKNYINDTIKDLNITFNTLKCANFALKTFEPYIKEALK